MGAAEASKKDIQSSSSSSDNNDTIKDLQSQIQSLQNQISQQETQLASQATALSTLSDEHYAEKSQLEQQINNIKEEAKKRIARAKDRVNDVTTTLQSKDKLIDELRSEGEKLSTAKGTIEQLCRQTKMNLENYKATYIMSTRRIHLYLLNLLLPKQTTMHSRKNSTILKNISTNVPILNTPFTCSRRKILLTY